VNLLRVNLPFSRGRRSLTPRGDAVDAVDAVLRRLDESGNPASEPDSRSTGGLTNWPVLGQLWASRKGANIIAHRSRLPSEPVEIPRSPDDPSANRMGSGNVTVIAGMQHLPEPPIVPKLPEDRCGICHHPVGHAQDCPTWGRVFGIGDWPSDY
jgi:hypothetical protein